MIVGVPRDGIAVEDWPGGGERPPGRRETPGGRHAAGFVEQTVAAAFQLPPDLLRRKSRGPARVAFARQVAIYLAHTRLGLSYAEAGAVFARDRTTASHACRVVEDRREDKRVDTLLDCLERSVDLWPGFVDIRGGRP
jgi:hypothetical protein